MTRWTATTMRWLLVFSQLSVLAVIGSVAHGFLFGARDELSIELPDAKELGPSITSPSDPSRQVDRVLAILYARDPSPPGELPPTPPPPRPPPLSDFVLWSAFLGEKSMAIIGEKDPSRPVSRPIMVGRRKVGARLERVPRTRHLYEGDTFRGCRIERITVYGIYYRYEDQEYLLERTRKPQALARFGDRLILEGRRPDDLRPTTAEHDYLIQWRDPWGSRYRVSHLVPK